MILGDYAAVPNKSHARAAGKRGFSIALPEQLIDQLETIAKEEHRSRNGQIEYFLERSVKEWKEQKTRASSDGLPAQAARKGYKLKPLPSKAAEDEGKSRRAK